MPLARPGKACASSSRAKAEPDPFLEISDMLPDESFATTPLQPDHILWEERGYVSTKSDMDGGVDGHTISFLCRQPLRYDISNQLWDVHGRGVVTKHQTLVCALNDTIYKTYHDTFGFFSFAPGTDRDDEGTMQAIVYIPLPWSPDDRRKWTEMTHLQRYEMTCKSEVTRTLFTPTMFGIEDEGFSLIPIQLPTCFGHAHPRLIMHGTGDGYMLWTSNSRTDPDKIRKQHDGVYHIGSAKSWEARADKMRRTGRFVVWEWEYENVVADLVAVAQSAEILGLGSEGVHGHMTVTNEPVEVTAEQLATSEVTTENTSKPPPISHLGTLGEVVNWLKERHKGIRADGGGTDIGDDVFVDGTTIGNAWKILGLVEEGTEMQGLEQLSH